MSFLLTWKQTLLDDATELWGIRVARVEIKDVRIPVQLQRSMAAEAEATREARAKVRATPVGTGWSLNGSSGFLSDVNKKRAASSPPFFFFFYKF